MQDSAKLTWRTEKRKVKDLIPWDKNPRKLTDAQAAQLEASLEKFDLVEIPAINTDNKLIAGHQRVYTLNLKGRGEEEIDVRVPNRQLTEAEFKEYNLRSNKNTGSWDDELLAEMDASLLAAVGFDSDELDRIFDEDTEEDSDPEQIAKEIVTPESQLGDIYQLGRHRLMCGDSTKPQNLVKLMDGKEADMIFTDPPYGVAYVGGTKEALEIDNDKLKGGVLKEFLDSAFLAMFNCLKSSGSWYVAGPSGSDVGMIFSNALLPYNWKHTLVWVKNTFVLGRADYHYRHEMLYYGWKEGAAHYFLDDRTKDTVFETEPTDAELVKWARNELDKHGDVWHFKKPARNAEHPTMKPIELVARAIRNSSRRDEIILDTFGGSGSTLMAAENIQRTCYTMEMDPRYADVIRIRWEKLTGEKAIKL